VTPTDTPRLVRGTNAACEIVLSKSQSTSKAHEAYSLHLRQVARLDVAMDLQVSGP
jgi:hypothetical protein